MTCRTFATDAPGERKQVVWWHHFERHEEDLALEEFEALKRSWGSGDCAIDTVDGEPALDKHDGWIWGDPI